MENNDLSQIVYLVILILIMSYGMINRKEMSLKKIVKYFLIWSLIGLIIIALYAYRFEFNDFKESWHFPWKHVRDSS